MGVECLLGYSVVEVVGQCWFDVFYDLGELEVWLGLLVDVEGNFFDVFEVFSVCVDGQIYLWQWMLLCKEGLLCQVCLLISCMEGVDGVCIGYVGMVIDIIEILQVWVEVWLLVEKFVGVFMLVVLGMVLVLLEGCWLDVNDVLCWILGYLCEELLQVDFQCLIYFDDLQIDLVLVQDLLVGWCSYYYFEKCYFDCDGCIIWVWLLVLLVCSEYGQLLYFVLQIQDIIVQCSSE